MVRVITQETFDSVVKENIKDFDMEKEEAIKEAKEQFESQVIMWARILDWQGPKNPKFFSAINKDNVCLISGCRFV